VLVHRSVVLIETTVKDRFVEMYQIDESLVSLTVSYSMFDKIQAIVEWRNLWNCLFLPRGKEKIFPSERLESNLNRAAHIKDRNDQIALFFTPSDNGFLTVVKWQDLKEALLFVRRRWTNETFSTRVTP